MEQKTTIGSYLATRLEEIGIRHYFAIPGDYNLILLDELIKNKNLKMINCCNELNAGYAADGYARANGVSALVVTFSVGALSAINAVAGAYAENLPMIVISGGPNTNSEIENQILHHTTGEPSDYKYVKNIFRHVTAKSVIIDQASEAPTLIDQAIVTALRERKPVYIEIACNLSEHRISKPNKFDFDFVEKSDPSSLKAAVEHAAKILNAAEKPILVGGAKIRSYNAIKAFKKLADASSYAVAMMPDAKGFFSEKHPHFIGIYWGSVSSPACGEIVESCDAYLFAGPIFSDYTTTGFSSLINPKKLLLALPRYVKIEGQTYNKVMLEEFLQALSKKIKKNPKSLLAYKRIRGEAPIEKASHSKETLSTRRLFARIQEMLTSRSVVIAETGDSWFNCMKLKLPEGCGFEIQMQYGSIGWSVGAALGNALGHKQPKHVIALIGDGSFQMTAQEVSTMIRYNVPLIIFLINNGSYTIEVQIHDNIYNVIKNWKYAELVDVFNAADGKGWSCQVKNEKELAAAIQKAQKHKGPSLIEVMIHRDDVNKSLLKWGTAVAMNNSRAPKGQSMFTYWV